MKNGLRNGSPPAGAQDGTAEVSARLQEARVTLAKLKKTHRACEQRLAAAQQELATLAEANEFLQYKLVRIEKKAEAANYLAYHDALTGLPNRRLLLDRLTQAVAQAARQNKRVALLFFDVNKFKEINDTLGHTGGDKLLQGVAQRLCACLRAVDTACRYGGDEFIVLLPEIEANQCVAVVEQKIRTQLATTYLIDGTEVRLTLSIGTAIYPVHAKDHRELIRLADAAMYQSKTNGGTPADGPRRL